MSFAPYEISLTAASGIWIYSPERDASASVGWNVSYTGSSTWPHVNGLFNGEGSLYLRTRFPGASIVADFVGTGLILCIEDNGATFSVRIDGHESTTDALYNEACIYQGASRAISFENQNFQSHRLEVNIAHASSKHEFQFFGAVIQTRIALLSDSDSVQERLIDDRDPGWDMQRETASGWTLYPDSYSDHSTVTTTCIYGHGRASEAAYAFSNTSAVVLRGLSHSNTGYYSVILEGDGKTLDSADNSMWTIPKTVLFFHSDLDPGKNYTLRFRNWRNSHPDCVDGRVVIDTMGTCCQAIDSLTLVGSAMRLSGSASSETTTLASASSASATPNVNNPSTNSALIAGSIVGGLLGALILFVAIFFLWRRWKRNLRSPPLIATPHPSTGRESPLPETNPLMHQLDTHASPPLQAGFIRHEPAGPSSDVTSYFPTTSHTQISRPSHSAGSRRATAVPSRPVIADLDRGGAPSQSTPSRSPGNPSGRSPLGPSTGRPKVIMVAADADQGTGIAVEMPPPYED